MLALLGILSPTGAAAEAPQTAAPTEHTTAVLINPLGPAVAVAANILGVPVFDANLRLHHVLRDSVGVTVQADLTRSRAEDLTVVHAGLRAGPRFSLRRRGLSDWTLTPVASVGATTMSAAHQGLARYAVLGVGVEAGRTWVWKRFTMELGLGAITTFHAGYATQAEALVDQTPATLSPVKPSITWGLGYAF